MTTPTATGRVPLGTIIRAHGVRGLVRVRPHDPSSEILGEVERVFLVAPEASPTRLTSGPKLVERTIEHAAREREEWLLKLEGVDDRDAAEALRGRSVEVPRDVLPEPEEDEVYISDLVGCDLVDGEGVVFGRVVRVDDLGAQDLLVAEGPKGEVLVPFVEPIVVSVDVEARRIVCDLPEGLVELSTSSGAPPKEEAE